MAYPNRTARTDHCLSQSPAKLRSAWVDTAKGLCIALVVMMHSTLGVGEAMGADGWLHAVVAFAKPFRIPAFFLIAGLFLYRTIDQPWRTYLDRKVLHFAYFYLLWAAIQIGLKVGVAEGVSPALHLFVQSLIEPFGTLWFIYLLPVFFIVTKMLHAAPRAAVLLGAALLEMAHVHTGWLVVDEFCARFVWFYAGYWMADYIFAWADLTRTQKLSALTFAAGFGLLNGMLVFKGEADHGGVSLFLGALGSLSLIAFAAALSEMRAGRWLIYAGRQSIVIYLAFFLPMIAMRAFLLHSGLAAWAGVGFTSLLVWIFAVTVPLAVYPLVMRTPLRFLFERPAWAQGRPQPRPVLRAAE